MKNAEYCDATRMGSPQGGMTSRLMRGFLQFWSDVSRRAAMRSEIMDLDRRGSLDTMLHDVGLTRPELMTMIDGYPASGRMLRPMADRIGVHLESVGIGTRHALSRECAFCHTHRACQRWLDNPAAEAEGYRKFCPNAPVLDVILAREAEGERSAP